MRYALPLFILASACSPALPSTDESPVLSSSLQNVDSSMREISVQANRAYQAKLSCDASLEEAKILLEEARTISARCGEVEKTVTTKLRKSLIEAQLAREEALRAKAEAEIAKVTTPATTKPVIPKYSVSDAPVE